MSSGGDLKAQAAAKYQAHAFGEAEGLYAAAAAAFAGEADTAKQAVCLANRAAALLALRRPGEAARDCVRASALDPAYARARQRLGVACVRAGGFSDALAGAAEPLRARLQALADARERGNAAYKAGDKSAAAEHYSAGLEAATDGGGVAPGASLLLCNRAACRAAAGDHAGALADAEAALAEDEAYTKAKLRKAAALACLAGREGEAAAAYRELRVALPGDQAVCDALYAAEQAAGVAGARKLTAGVIQVESEGEYRQHLREAPGLVVVDFTASWCGPCRMIAPHFAAMALDFKTTTFLKVDVDEVSAVSMAENVRSMPTFKLYKGGRAVEVFSGADAGRLRALVAQHAPC